MSKSLTGVMNAVVDGSAGQNDELLPMIYQELRAVAHARLRQHRRSDALSTTALVHEAYLKLVGSGGAPGGFRNRRHFFATAAIAMRQVLVDQARKRLTEKRGGNLQEITFDEELLAADAGSADLVSLNDAIGQLEKLEPRLVEVVDLRFFAGLEWSEVAELTQVSRRTVIRDWNKARAFLHARLAESED